MFFVKLVWACWKNMVKLTDFASRLSPGLKSSRRIMVIFGEIGDFCYLGLLWKAEVRLQLNGSKLHQRCLHMLLRSKDKGHVYLLEFKLGFCYLVAFEKLKSDYNQAWVNRVPSYVNEVKGHLELFLCELLWYWSSCLPCQGDSGSALAVFSWIILDIA